MFFYHDSDHDYRETITAMRDLQTNEIARLNFTQENKIQKKFSPLYAKRIPAGWKEEILKQLPRFMEQKAIELFAKTSGATAGEFCLNMYKGLGLLESVEVVPSGDPAVRERASDLEDDFFADVSYEDEIVRARSRNNGLTLHEGGERYITLPPQAIEKKQKNPDRDQRFAWMQSVVNCTHYILGEGEAEYLDITKFPAITFIARKNINEPELAWLPDYE